MTAAKTTTITQTRTLRAMVMVAACFAIGSIGFFLAVLLQHTAQPAVLTTQGLNAVQQQKEAAMRSLAASEQTPTASTSNANPSISQAPPKGSGVSPAQADTQDPNAAAKLKILEGLNSQ